MRSVPGAVATGSHSTPRWGLPGNNPVATAPGTDCAIVVDYLPAPPPFTIHDLPFTI